MFERDDGNTVCIGGLAATRVTCTARGARSFYLPQRMPEQWRGVHVRSAAVGAYQNSGRVYMLAVPQEVPG